MVCESESWVEGKPEIAAAIPFLHVNDADQSTRGEAAVVVQDITAPRHRGNDRPDKPDRHRLCFFPALVLAVIAGFLFARMILVAVVILFIARDFLARTILVVVIAILSTHGFLRDAI